MAVLICIPAKSIRALSFFVSDTRHSNWREMIFHIISICISLMASNIVSSYVSTIYISSSEKCLFKPFTHLLTGFFEFLLLFFVASKY